ncbi:MAG TPA: TIGR03663 family protein [bacterium]|nr:TIGR03663 family protein [bacterium]
MEKELTRPRTPETDTFFKSISLNNWLWIALFLFVAFTRFHHLGDKPFHHDESLYAKYIWNFHTGQGYKYDPMQHGPFLFHVSQVTLTMFGVSDYSVRIVPALTGIALIWFLFYLRRRMPPGVALMTGWLFAINSVFMYFQRFLRHDPLFSLFAVLSVFLALLWFHDKKQWQFYTFSACCAILYCIKENAFIHFLTMYIFAFGFLLVWWFFRKNKLSELFAQFPMAFKVMAAVTYWGISFVIYAIVNQEGKAWFGNWEKALHTYWIVVYILFFLAIGYLVYLGEKVRSNPDAKPLKITPEFFKDSHIFAIGTILFFGIIVLLYTTFSRNPDGFWGAMYKWYEYWMHQHSIARIAGPFHYYHHQMLIYAFLPLSVTLLALMGRAIRRNRLIFTGYIVFSMLIIWGFKTIKSPLPLTKDSLFTNEHLAMAIVVLLGGVLMTLSYLFQKATFKAFLVWWITFSYLIYSYLQEKVPWLTMHIITPMILYAAIVLVEFFRDKKSYYAWSRWTAKILLSIVIIYAVHTSVQLCFYNEADPVEQMVYVQTTYEIPELVKEIEEIARWENTLHEKELPMVINGHATWPLYWYLRDWKGISYGTNVNPAQHRIVICNWEDRHKFAEKCGDKYVVRKYGLRAWFLPRLNDVKKDGKFLRNAWRWVMYRERFNPSLYGAQMICVFTRKDVSRFDWSVDLGAAPEPPQQREPPRRDARVVPNLMQFGSFGSQAGNFNTPKDIAVDKDGNIFVADLKNNRIAKFDKDGKFLLEWGRKGTEKGQFDQPIGLCVDPQGNVYVADTWNHRIQKFDTNGNFEMTFGDSTVFWAPKDIVIDDAGYLYISNTGYHNIKKYTRGGKEVWTVGTKGSGPLQFTEPVGLALDNLGRVYVADTANKRISVFDKDGHHVKQINAYGLEEYYTEPFLSFDPEDKIIYMTDSRNHNIQMFDTNGSFLGFWGREGNGNGQFKQPLGIECSGGRLYVTDAQNHNVQVFDTQRVNP